MFNKKKNFFDASEVFIDSKNLSNLNKTKSQEILEKPIKKQSFISFLILIIFIFSIFLFQTFWIQIINGKTYLQKATNNVIKKSILFSKRGVILDRNNQELVWNEEFTNKDFLKRVYINKIGFSHLLGFISYPKKDKNNFYFTKEYVGKSGIEKEYNNLLNGKLGYQFLKVGPSGNIITKGKQVLPTMGQNIILSINADVQEILAKHLNNYIKKWYFNSGVAMIMNVENGQIIAMVSLPETDSNILISGEYEEIKKMNKDSNKPFLNRVTLGQFAPGSITKPFIALKALQENIFNPYKWVQTNGRLVIPNKYHPDQPFILPDYHNYGAMDLMKALYKSSNVYFAMLAGGYKNQVGLGIKKLKENFQDFGIGELSGQNVFKEVESIIPDPKWKKKTFGTNWTVGNTYQTAIGQYGFLATPIQVLVGVSAIANEGDVLVPKFLKDAPKEIKRKIQIDTKNWKLVKKGMRQVVTKGTGMALNIPYLEIAGKSGTAQVGKGLAFRNSWFIGFFPYQKPKYAFVLMAEHGRMDLKPPLNTVAFGVGRKFFDEIKEKGILNKLLKD